jgi:lipopolysaccharide export system permease protein
MLNSKLFLASTVGARRDTRMANYPRRDSEKSKRSRTFERGLVVEFTGIAAGVFLVLVAIVLVTTLVRLLGLAAGGVMASEAVWAFLGFRVLNFLPVVLAISVFVSVLLALTRSYRDSEMVVWFSSGLSLMAWVRPVLLFSLPLVVTIALLTLLLSPWASSRSEDYQHELDAREDVSLLTPGVFHESKQADRVFFLEAKAGDQTRVANIFVQSIQQQRLGVMVAREGFQGLDEKGDRYVVLLNGTRYEVQAGSAEYRTTQFERYWMRVSGGNPREQAQNPSSLSTLSLIEDQTPINTAELHWRLGLPLSALVLALIAIPLSFVNPRGGRSVNLILAILVYAIYSNLLGMMRLWVSLGKVSTVLGFFTVHVLMLVLLVLLFYRRISMRFFARLWR